MTIDETIRELKEASIEASNNGLVERVNALELGIEAFNRLKLLRKRRHPIALELLPGETEESPSPLKGEEGQEDDPKKGDRK